MFDEVEIFPCKYLCIENKVYFFNWINATHYAHVILSCFRKYQDKCLTSGTKVNITSNHGIVELQQCLQKI